MGIFYKVLKRRKGSNRVTRSTDFYVSMVEESIKLEELKAKRNFIFLYWRQSARDGQFYQFFEEMVEEFNRSFPEELISHFPQRLILSLFRSNRSKSPSRRAQSEEAGFCECEKYERVKVDREKAAESCARAKWGERAKRAFIRRAQEYST